MDVIHKHSLLEARLRGVPVSSVTLPKLQENDVITTTAGSSPRGQSDGESTPPKHFDSNTPLAAAAADVTDDVITDEDEHNKGNTRHVGEEEVAAVVEQQKQQQQQQEGEGEGEGPVPAPPVISGLGSGKLSVPGMASVRGVTVQTTLAMNRSGLISVRVVPTTTTTGVITTTTPRDTPRNVPRGGGPHGVRGGEGDEDEGGGGGNEEEEEEEDHFEIESALESDSDTQNDQQLQILQKKQKGHVMQQQTHDVTPPQQPQQVQLAKVRFGLFIMMIMIILFL